MFSRDCRDKGGSMVELMLVAVAGADYERLH